MKECCKKKERASEEKHALINRLNRIEGQIRGIKNMIENDAYCPDVLIQVSAASSALGAFNRKLLAEHIRTCVASGIEKGDKAVVDELLDTLKHIQK